MKSRANSGRYKTPASARAASMQGRLALQAAIDNEAFAGLEDFCASDPYEIAEDIWARAQGTSRKSGGF